MSTPRLALITSVTTVIFFGLAILGAGGFSNFFSHPQLIAVAVATLVMVTAALFTQGNISPGVREARENRWVIAAFALLGLLVAGAPARTDRGDFWTIDGDTVRWIGVALYIVGGALRIWPVFLLGRRFSGLVAIQKEHRLLTTGIYGVIRHPSYLGLLVKAIGWVARLPLCRGPAACGACGPDPAHPHPRRGRAAAIAVRR